MALDLDEQYYAQGYQFIVGCDEAGRGCLLGPVFAAAVILPQGLKSDLINDSKKLTAKKREEKRPMNSLLIMLYRMPLPL